MDCSRQPLIISFNFLILFDDSSIAYSKLFFLSSEAQLLFLKLWKAQLLLDDILLVGDTALMHRIRILLRQLKCLLCSNLQVKHVLTLDFFVSELFKHYFSLVSLVLQLVMKLHFHLSLGLEIFGFLVSLSDASALNLVLKLEILFVNSPFFRQSLLDLRIAHLFLIIEILDTWLSNWDIDFNKICFLTGLISLGLRLLS